VSPLEQPAGPAPLIVGENRLVHAALRHPDLSVDHPFRATRQLFGPTAIDVDGLRHRRLRPHVAWFSSRQVAVWEDRAITPVVRDLVAALPRGEPVDFMSVAWQLPTRVILRTLGCPDRDAAWVWRRLGPVLRHIAHPGSPVEPAAACADLGAYIGDVLAAAPPADTVLGSLPDRVGGPGGGPDGRDGSRARTTVVRTALLLLAAGTATTAAGAGNLLATLLRHPGTWEALRDGTLPPSAVVREALRMLPPLRRTVRFAKADVMLDGLPPVPRGSVVELDIAAANLDPATFDCPHAFRPRRSGPPALSFGTGPHACVGALLALRELEGLLQALTRRFGSMTTAASAPPTIAGDVFYQPERLDVVFH
jgi:cytochrome P450